MSKNYAEENEAFERFMFRHWFAILMVIVCLCQWLVISDMKYDIYGSEYSAKLHLQQYNDLNKEFISYKKRNEEINKIGFYFNDRVIVTKGFFTGQVGNILLRMGNKEYKIKLDNYKNNLTQVPEDWMRLE